MGRLFSRFLVILALIVFLLVVFLSPRVDTFLNSLVKPSGGPPGITEKVKIVSEESAIISVVAQASPAVVSVTTRQVVFDIFRGPLSESASIGTGFVVRSDGLVVTNRHVVSEREVEYTVVTKDGKNYGVKKIYRDPVNDLALLRIEAKDLPTLSLGDSGKIKVGQTAIAIGNALGRFSNTVTTGIISGIGRGVSASSGFGFENEILEDVLQTSAALNPGNSGGPLLNSDGQVVGVNVAVTEGAQNIGFAIPANILKNVLTGFDLSGKISQPFLGVQYQMVTPDIAEIRRLPVGAFIERVVDGSAAQKAGLQAGDIITELEGRALNSEYSLSKAIRSKKVGDSVRLKIDRLGKELPLVVTIGEASE